MSKRCGLAIVTVFLVWQVMDFLIQTIILMPQYETTASLWRPVGEMKIGLIMLVGLIAATTFCVAYDRFFGKKSMSIGALYAHLVGIGVGAILKEA